MFIITKIGNHRLDIEMSGQLDSDSMKKALDDLLIQSESIENGQMLYEIIDFQLPTASAIGIEFSRLPSMLGLMKKFNRAAVLTDKNWLKIISKIEGALIPGLEIKAFNRDQRAQAESWLSE